VVAALAQSGRHFPGCCCDADEFEHLARDFEADSRKPQVHAGKWPVDPISRRIEHLGNIDMT
jgi:hypothetical protein